MYINKLYAILATVGPDLDPLWPRSGPEASQHQLLFELRAYSHLAAGRKEWLITLWPNSLSSCRAHVTVARKSLGVGGGRFTLEQ